MLGRIPVGIQQWRMELPETSRLRGSYALHYMGHEQSSAVPWRRRRGRGTRSALTGIEYWFQRLWPEEWLTVRAEWSGNGAAGMHLLDALLAPLYPIKSSSPVAIHSVLAEPLFLEP